MRGSCWDLFRLAFWALGAVQTCGSPSSSSQFDPAADILQVVLHQHVRPVAHLSLLSSTLKLIAASPLLFVKNAEISWRDGCKQSWRLANTLWYCMAWKTLLGQRGLFYRLRVVCGCTCTAWDALKVASVNQTVWFIAGSKIPSFFQFFSFKVETDTFFLQLWVNNVELHDSHLFSYIYSACMCSHLVLSYGFSGIVACMPCMQQTQQTRAVAQESSRSNFTQECATR